MQIKLLADNFVTDLWPNPQRGQVRDVPSDFANHLISQGLAMALKIETPAAKKLEASSSVSRADQASLSETAPRRRGKRVKQ